jgi:hypothetical protein
VVGWWWELSIIRLVNIDTIIIANNRPSEEKSTHFNIPKLDIPTALRRAEPSILQDERQIQGRLRGQAETDQPRTGRNDKRGTRAGLVLDGGPKRRST